MKKVLLIAYFFITCVDFAQPVITSSWMAAEYQMTQRREIHPAEEDTFNAGPSGANQVWDFSALTPYSLPETLTYFPLTGNPFASQFPSATLVSEVTTVTSSGDYSYYQTSGNEFSNIGFANNEQVRKYSDAGIMLKFPLTFNSGHSDSSYYLTTHNDGSKDYGRVFSTILVDGYGTLKTPFKTFPNVLRVKVIESHIDSFVQSNGSPGGFYSSMDTVLCWIDSTNNGAFLMLAIKSTLSSGIFKYVFYTSLISSNTRNQMLAERSINLYPNPASDHLTIEGDFDNASQALISDVSGKFITSISLEKSSEHKYHVNTSELAAGLYLLTIESENNRFNRKISVSR